MTAEQEVLAAADALVAAFGRSDRDAYFACFVPQATFLFHPTPGRIESRAAYEQLWDSWVAQDGFRVISCRSTGALVQFLGPDAAVFSHDVLTTVQTNDGEDTTAERETIVFSRTAGHWLAVHEHLSPDPAAVGGT